VVGFLSLLNGILNPAEVRGSSPVRLQPAKLPGIDVPPHRSSGYEKDGANVRGVQKTIAGKLQSTAIQPAPELAARSAPAGAQAAFGVSPTPEFTGEALESTGRPWEPLSNAVPPPNDLAKEPAARVAFALRLTQQNAEPASGSQTRSTSSPATALIRAQSASPAPPPAPPPSAVVLPAVDAKALWAAPFQSIGPWPHPGNAGSRSLPRDLAQRDLVEPAAPRDNNSPTRNPGSIAGLTPKGESSRGVNEAEEGLQSEVGQPLISTTRTATQADPRGARPEGDFETGRTSSEPLVKPGNVQTPLRPQTFAAQGSAFVRPQATSGQEQGNRPGDERNNPEPDAKAPKLCAVEKPAMNQENVHAHDATGLFAVLPGQTSVGGRISPRTEPAHLDSPAASRVLPEIGTDLSIRPRPIREISLKLADNASNLVDIQVVARAGKVQVAVHTADQELAKSLQTNLGELVGRLELKGYKTETWIPGAPLHANAAMEPTRSLGHSQDQREHSSSGHEQRQREHQQESGRRQPPRWMTQIENTFDGEDASTEANRMQDR